MVSKVTTPLLRHLPSRKLSSEVALAPASVVYYDRNAPSFGARFDETSFKAVHQDLLPLLPPKGSRILDVGAGSGRDAVALERMGYLVTAVEPSTNLQAWALKRYGATTIIWIEDRLPSLAKTRANEQRYDFVLCSAVLMHVEPADLKESFQALAELLKYGGKLALSLRDRRADDPPEIFHNHLDSGVSNAASAAGLQLTQRTENADRFGRQEVLWRSFLFCKSNDDHESPV